MTIRNLLTVATIVCLSLVVGAASVFASPASRWNGDGSQLEFSRPTLNRLPSVDAALSFDGGAVDFDAALTAGADYLQNMQADITEDNAGNGTDGVNETPDDPDDGGWDWRVTSPPAPFFHTTAASPTNIFGATAGGLLEAFKETGDAGYYTAMTDAAGAMVADPNIRSGADLVYLMNYNDLPPVVGTSYADAARTKYDARIVTYGSAQAFVEYIRDVRGVTQGYPNGIIAWDIGIWVRIAAMLDVRYPGNGYGADAIAMAEVLWQDSFNDNPGLFDVVDDAGWDPAYGDVNFYWYNLGITGLIDAFDAAGVHTDEIPGLVTLLLDGQAAHGGISYCYGGNIGDDDWQSTAYAMLTLASLDQSTYQTEIDNMGFFLAATQDASGGWRYSSGNHYPEIGGECTAGLYYTTNATTYDLADAIVDATFTWQGDVDVYNAANGTSFVWGYNAFGTIQEAIDAVDGSTVYVGPGTYVENLLIDKYVEIIGAGSGSDPLTNTIITQTAAGAGDSRIGVVQLAFSGTSGSPILLQDLRLEPDGMAGISVGRFTEATAQTVEYVKLDNVHVVGTNVNPSTEQERGLYVDLTSTLRYLDVDDCAFDNLTYGWYFQKEVSADASTVEYVTVDNTTFNHNNHKGVYAEKLSEATFTGCTADANGFDSSVLPSYFMPWSAGIDINLKAGTYANIAFITCIITNNATDEAKEGVGLTVKARDDGATYGAFPASVDNVDVIGCTITGNERGLRFGEPDKDNASPTNVTVEDCTIMGNVQNYSGIDGSAYGGLINMVVAGVVVDASPNWWGDQDASDQVAGEVDWAPWWTDASMTTLGYPPIHNLTQDTYFWTIQAAIDGATAGDDIAISAGTFVAAAQIVVDKDITLTGAGSASTIIAPGFNTSVGYYLVSDALMYVDYGVTATIEELGIDGTGFTVRHGIQSRGADLTVRNCDFQNIYANIYAGRGIVYLTGTGLVENCTMANIQRIGVHVRGGIEPTAPDVDIIGLTYVGKGAGDFLDYGVEFGGGGTGTVQNSSITACLGVASADGSTSAAILATDYYGTGTAATVSGCTLTGNTTGIYAGYAAGDGTVLVAYDNDLTGNDLGIMSVTATPVDASPNWWGDIDPTDDVSGDVVVYPCYTDASMTTLFAPVTNITQTTYFVDIQPAIDAANPGDELHLATGTFAEGPQIHVDKNLSIVGQGAVTIVPTASTGSAGDARGWFLVDAGVLFNLSDVTLDGAGFDIYQGVRSHGGGVYDNVNFANMVFPGYSGVGLAVFGADNVTITNCEFTNMGRIGALLFGAGLTDSYFTHNTYTGKGDGDWLDYAADISAGAVVTVDDCVITNCTGVASSDGSTSAGLLVSTYYGAGTTANITNCDISGCTSAIAVGYDGADVSTVVAYHNSFTGNDFGITNTGVGAVNAEENWWGTADGAEIYALVGGLIDFSPWCSDDTHSDCTLTSNIGITATSSLLKCGDVETLWIGVAEGVSGVEAANFKIGFDHNYVTPTAVVKAPPYDVSGMFLSYTIDNAADSIGIDVGITEGAFDGPGNLIGIEFTAIAEVASTEFTFERSVLRDGANQDIYHETGGASVEIDCTLPDAPTDLVVLPGHERIRLSWTNPTGDPTFAGIEIRRNPWAVGAYPEYDDFSPAIGYPATELDGDQAYVGTDEAYIDDATLPLTRSVYHYTIFAFDNAGNYSAVTAAQQGRATNYWLGDVSGAGQSDGNVYYGDLQVLSNTYGNSDGDPSYEAEFDIGPTVTGSPRGIPTTDNVVNFEDLAIFAINFNVVGPGMKVVPIFEEVPVDGPLTVALYRPTELVEVGEEFTVSVSLQNNPGTVKALAFDLAYDPTELAFVGQSSSDNLQRADAPVFYNGRVTDNGVEVALALLGGTNTIGGSGELSEVTFRVLKPGANLLLENVDARDAQNQKLTVDKDNNGSAPGGLIPDSYSLAQNYPNPFNPATTVSYELPVSGRVSLEVFNIVGQRVATLVDEFREAGAYEVRWDAADVASGIYFYRLTAEDFVQTRKMILLK